MASTIDAEPLRRDAEEAERRRQATEEAIAARKKLRDDAIWGNTTFKQLIAALESEILDRTFSSDRDLFRFLGYEKIKELLGSFRDKPEFITELNRLITIACSYDSTNYTMLNFLRSVGATYHLPDEELNDRLAREIEKDGMRYERVDFWLKEGAKFVKPIDRLSFFTETKTRNYKWLYRLLAEAIPDDGVKKAILSIINSIDGKDLYLKRHLIHTALDILTNNPPDRPITADILMQSLTTCFGLAVSETGRETSKTVQDEVARAEARNYTSRELVKVLTTAGRKLDTSLAPLSLLGEQVSGLMLFLNSDSKKTPKLHALYARAQALLPRIDKLQFVRESEKNRMRAICSPEHFSEVYSTIPKENPESWFTPKDKAIKLADDTVLRHSILGEVEGLANEVERMEELDRCFPEPWPNVFSSLLKIQGKLRFLLEEEYELDFGHTVKINHFKYPQLESILPGLSEPNLKALLDFYKTTADHREAAPTKFSGEELGHGGAGGGGSSVVTSTSCAVSILPTIEEYAALVSAICKQIERPPGDGTYQPHPKADLENGMLLLQKAADSEKKTRVLKAIGVFSKEGRDAIDALYNPDASTSQLDIWIYLSVYQNLSLLVEVQALFPNMRDLPIKIPNDSVLQASKAARAYMDALAKPGHSDEDREIRGAYKAELEAKLAYAQTQQEVRREPPAELLPMTKAEVSTISGGGGGGGGGGGTSDSAPNATHTFRTASQGLKPSKLKPDEGSTIREAINTLKREKSDMKVGALTELLNECVETEENKRKSVGDIIQEICKKPEYKKVRAGIISHRTRDILEALEKKYPPTQLGTAPRT